MLIPISPLLIKFSISAHFETKEFCQKSPPGRGQTFFCLKNWKFDQKRGYKDQHLIYICFEFIIENFDYIIPLAPKYQFFVKNPTGFYGS